MKDIDNLLTSSKNLSKKNHLRTKSFGYQVLGFGAGGSVSPFITATGGTITTSGNDRIHTFTSPGTFTVCVAAKCAADNLVSYLVVAGGGGAAGNLAGGGGGGGFRETKSPSTPYTASPLDGYATPGNRITVTATGYPITVGAGGNGACGCYPSVTNGANSIFSSITSAGGGHGGCATVPQPQAIGAAGGSGGGEAGGSEQTYGAGNTPPTTPPQGNPGGPGSGGGQFPHLGAGGGGGATAAGSAGNTSTAGPGGAGAGTLINPATGEAGPGPSRYYAGGAGGGLYSGSSWGTGGIGGGSSAGPDKADPARNGTANTGGGASGYGNGGSGIVIIRYKIQQDKLWHILQKYQKIMKYLQF